MQPKSKVNILIPLYANIDPEVQAFKLAKATVLKHNPYYTNLVL